MSTIRVNAIQNTNANSGNMLLHANGNVSMTTSNTTLFIGNTAISNAGISVGGAAINPLATGMRNRIINGDMQIWQRGTSSSSPGSLIADRWYISTGTTVTGSQSSDVPSGFKYSLSISGTNYPQSYQRIESLNCVDLVGKSITISFWAKQTSGAGSASLALAIYTADSTDNFSSATGINNVTFTGTTGWVQYSTTFTNLPANTVNGLQVLIYANTTGAATFLFTGFQLEVGTIATPFEFRHYGTELNLCQRYFQTTYNPGTALGTATRTGLVGGTTATYATAWYGISGSFNLPVPMRATPTVTYWDGAGNLGKYSYIINSTWTDNQATVGTAANITLTSRSAFYYGLNASAPWSIYVHYGANAEL